MAAGVAALGLLGAAGAPAAARAATAPFPVAVEFELRGSKGYDIDGYVFGSVAVIEASSGQVAAEYVVKGRRAGGRFVARFGSLGRLSLRFQPANARERCALFQRGTLRGAIEFAGERGYTEVDARAAPGFAFAFPSGDCLAAAAATSPGTIHTHLHAVAKRPDGAASISVFRALGFGRAFVLASLVERRGAMTVTRYAFSLVGGGNAFVSSGPAKHPAIAYLEPPKPFAGSALFEETGESAASWTGSLSAWMPGAGRVPLAGPRFSSNLCRRRAGQPGCALEPAVRRPLSALQGSGSQSQLFAEARLSWSRYLRNSASSAGSTP